MSGIFPYPTRVGRLDNGLEVVLIPKPRNGLAAYWTIVRTGSGDEHEAGRSGFAHFFEHMMFRGTERYPSDVYQRILTEIGADANAFTTDDLTAYHISAAAEDLERIVELESDRFKHLAYSEADFETEAGAVYGEYRKLRSDPLFTLQEAVAEAAFDVHPYGHTTMGLEADIAAMPSMYAYSREFFSRYYRPDNTVVLVVGDFDPDRVMRLIESRYGDWAPGYLRPPVPQEPAQRGERRVDVSYPGRTLPIAWLAYKLGRFDPADRVRVAADLLADLAFGPTSEAFRRLVLEEQVVEVLQADAGMNRDPGLLDIVARIKEPDRVDYVLDVIDETAAAWRTSPPQPEKLDAAKSHLHYDFLMSLDTADAVAESLARPLAVAGSIDGVDALYAAYRGVTPEDVRAAAETWLADERRTVGVLRPEPPV